MGSYKRQKPAVSISISRPPLPSPAPLSEDPNAVNREFEVLGEEEVRLRLQFNVFDEETAERAHDWLADREYLNFGDDIRSVRAFARRTNDLALDSIRLAQKAKSEAQDANAIAVEAKEYARNALETAAAATAQLRSSARVTTMALIAAGIALSVTVGAIMFH